MRDYGRFMRRVVAAVLMVSVSSSCSLFTREVAPTTTTSSVASTTSTSTTTTTTTIPASARIDDLPDVDENSPASLIRVAQRLATARGFRTDVDGDFGRQTRARVNALRESFGLEPTGVIDAEVWRAAFDESTLPFGPVDPNIIGGVTVTQNLRVPEISFLFDEVETDTGLTTRYLIPFFVDGEMFAQWAQREATLDLGDNWTVCEPVAASGNNLVTLTGVSSDGDAFTYQVVFEGSGRVDISIAVSSGALGQCP